MKATTEKAFGANLQSVFSNPCEKWQMKKLGGIISLEYGKPLLDSQRDSSGLYPVYGANGIKDRTNEFYWDKPSIIVGRKGSAGEINITESKFWPLDVTYFIKFDEELYDLRFLYYLLKTLNLPQLAKGVKPGINRNEVYSVEVCVPESITEQHRIVSILDEAFSEIDEAKVITEKNLENARQLFESYLEKIFTNHRSDWKKNNLKSLTTKIGSGATPLGGEKAYKSSGISLIRSLNVYDYEFRLKNLAFIDDEQAGKLDNVIVMEDDVLLNITGASVARCFLVPFNILPARVNQHVSIIRCSKDQILPEFLHYLLISKPYKDLLLNTGEKGGATRQALTKNQIENFVIKYPSLDEQIDIIGKLDKLLKESTKLKILYNQKLTHLEELKKSILKQAFEGKL